MSKANPNRLLVEGDEDKRVIPNFMDKHVIWGENENEWLVEIKQFGGIDSLMTPGVIETQLKSPGLKALGIIVDANDHFDSRWASVRERCLRVVSDFPEDLPPGGLIHQDEYGLRVGVWLMPDNKSRGMLETFLSYLCKPELSDLWSFASESCKRSRDHGAPYSDAHFDKASIHTHLAWCDPPGLSLHVALLRGALDARLPLGQHFVKWFIDLFQLTPRTTGLS